MFIPSFSCDGLWSCLVNFPPNAVMLWLWLMLGLALIGLLALSALWWASSRRRRV